MGPINTNPSLNQITHISSGSTQNLNDVVATLAHSNNVTPVTSTQSFDTATLPQSLLDSFYQGVSAITNVTAPGVSNYLNQFSQQQASQGKTLSIKQQQTLLQYSMSQLNQTENNNAILFQAIHQTLMGTFMTNMMLSQYMRDIFNKDKEDNHW
jgi:hypothetical protein